MADRVLTWFLRDASDLAALPRYYMDAEYEKSGLRVHADTPPVTGDLRIDIRASGVSIFQNAPESTFTSLGQRTTVPTTTLVLVKGDNTELDAEDFNDDSIPLDSWVTCVIADLRGAKGVTIQLELRQIGEPNQAES